MTEIRVQFAHGLEGSPQGAKARLLAAHFDARTPEMDTRDVEACIELHARCAREFRPHVLVGSSFGGAIALALLQRGLWAGPTLLLAQAGLRMGFPAELPADVPVCIVHGRADTLIDPDDSRRLARAGHPDRVRLIEPDDDHALSGSVADETLLTWVRDLASAAVNAPVNASGGGAGSG